MKNILKAKKVDGSLFENRMCSGAYRGVAELTNTSAAEIRPSGAVLSPSRFGSPNAEVQTSNIRSMINSDLANA